MPSVYLVRHASPDWNRKDIPYHLPPGPPLTEQGLVEAHALGQFLRLVDVQQLWTSPLERCQHTAEIIAGITGAPVTVNQELREWQPQERKERCPTAPCRGRSGMAVGCPAERRRRDDRPRHPWRADHGPALGAGYRRPYDGVAAHLRPSQPGSSGRCVGTEPAEPGPIVGDEAGVYAASDRSIIAR